MRILYIDVDSLRPDHLGCYGYHRQTSPIVDQIAAEGVRFENVYVSDAACMPSRTALFSGRFGIRTGVVNHGGAGAEPFPESTNRAFRSTCSRTSWMAALRGQKLHTATINPSTLRTRMVGCRTPDDPRFVTRQLTMYGYQTASIGKIHLRPQGEEPAAVAAGGDYYGFQTIDLVNGHGDKCFGPDYTSWLHAHTTPEQRDRQKQPRRYKHGTGDTYAYDLPLEVHPTTYIGNRTVEFLDRVGTQPFFLHVSFPDPHQPFCAPEPYASRYRPEEMPPPLRPLDDKTMPPWYKEAYTGGKQPLCGRSADGPCGSRHRHQA
jgi:arylsulfatase A-like enzyme